MKTALLVILDVLVAYVLSAHAQHVAPQVSPVVLVGLRPISALLKAKLKTRFVLSCGLTSFGTKTNPIWGVSLAGTQPGQNDRVEFWQQGQGNSLRLLRRMLLPPLAGQPVSTRSFKWDGIQLRWLFPAQRRGPVIVANVDNGCMVYAFEKGWQDKHPIVQKLEMPPDAGNNYDFDSVDQKGVLQGEVFIYYHMTSAEDLPGEYYRAFWRSGRGWIDPSWTAPLKYSSGLLPD